MILTADTTACFGRKYNCAIGNAEDFVSSPGGMTKGMSWFQFLYCISRISSAYISDFGCQLLTTVFSKLDLAVQYAKKKSCHHQARKKEEIIGKENYVVIISI